MISSKLAIGLVIGASINGAVSGIKQVSNALKTLRDSSLSVDKKASAMFSLSKGSFKTAATTLTGVGTSLMALSKPAIDFESAMADVKKVVDFKTPEGFKNLSKDILGLTRTLPMSAEELAAITASGGQLGVAEEDLKDFTTTIAKMSVAFDMSADASGDAMAKLANVYKIPISKIGNLGDAINELSNSSPAKASDIVNTLGRIGGTAKQFGLTENAAAALSNSFISLGKTPEVAGTAINGMLTKLMTAEKGGKAFQNAMGQVGISATQLKKNIAKDGQAALVDFLKRIEKLPKDKAMGVLVDLFGREYADDVAVLAGNIDVLDKSLKTLQDTDENGNPKYLGSMEKEFSARAATTENSLKLLKNSVTEVGISLGSQLLPVINTAVQSIMPIVHWVADWINQNQELTATILKLVAGAGVGFAGVSLLTGGITGAIGVFLKFKDAISLLFTGLGKLLGLFRFFTPVILKLAYGFGSIIGYTLRFAMVLGGSLVKGLMLAGRAVLFLGRAFMMNPIDIAVMAIAGAAYLIYTYWEPIKSFFLGLWEQVKTAFDGGIAGIGALILNWSPLGLFYKAFAGVLSWFGVDLPNQFTDFGKNIIDGLVNGIFNAWALAKEKVSELGSGIKNWFAETLGIHSPSRVFMGFGENTVQGLTIGIAKTAIQAANAAKDLGKAVIQPVEKSAKKTTALLKKGHKPTKSTLIPKTTAVQADPRLLKLGEIPTLANMPKPITPTTSTENEGWWSGLSSGFDEMTKNFSFGWEQLKSGVSQWWDELDIGRSIATLGQTQDNPWQTPDFNPNVDTPYADYQPLNRNMQTNDAGQQSCVVVHFNQTINVNGGNGQGVMEQVQQGLQIMSMQEFERFFERMIDEKMRRSY